MKSFIRGSFIQLLPAVFLFAGAAFAQIHPTSGGDFQRTGRSPYVGPAGAITHSVTEAPTIRGIKTAAAVALDGSIYMGSDSGLLAFDRFGEPLWILTTFGPITTTPTIAFDGTIYSGHTTGLAALYHDGSRKWEISIAGGAESSPALTADKAVLVTGADGLYRFLDQGTFAQGVCSFPNATPKSPVSVAENGIAYFGTGTETKSAGRLYAVDSSCSLVWSSQSSGTAILPAPTVDSAGNIYVVSSNINGNFVDKFSSMAGLKTGTAVIPQGDPSSVALSVDDSLLYVASGSSLTAIDSATMTTQWTVMGDGSNDSAPLVDADGIVYWTSANSIRAYTDSGELALNQSTPHDTMQLTSPVLGALGNLYVGGTKQVFLSESAVLHILGKDSAWPNSDTRLDLASSDGITYADGLYNHMTGMAAISYMNTPNLLKVDKRSGSNPVYWVVDTSDNPKNDIPIYQDREDYIRSFNPDFFSYNNALDGPEHFTRFAHFWNSNNPHQPLGSYVSAPTCVDNPQDPANTSMVGNKYPANVLNCCEIADTADCHVEFDTAPFYNDADGRYWLPIEDGDVVDKAMDHLTEILKEQHLTDHVFLDNGRYYTAHYQNAGACHDCITACTSESCIESCKSGALCVNDKDNDPVTVTFGSSYEVMAEDLVDYYAELLATVNSEGHRGILNVSVTPCEMGDYIEEERLANFEEALGAENGLAFEQAWHWNCRSRPRYIEQEMRLYRRFLDNGMLVMTYPNYKNSGEQAWTAALSVNYREPGDSLFLSRSPYVDPPFWSDWPEYYAPEPGSPLSFHVDPGCPTCMTSFREFGSWYVTRDFQSDRKVTAVGELMQFSVENAKSQNSSLGSQDITATHKKDLSELLASYNLDAYQVTIDPQLGTLSLDPVTNDLIYTVDNAELVAEFNELYAPIDFGGAGFRDYKMSDYFALGKDCGTEHCEEIVVTAVQFFIRVDNAATNPWLREKPRCR